MRIKVYCKNHANSRVRMLEGTVKYRYDKGDTLVSESEEAANVIELDEANFYCEGRSALNHEFGYYIQI